MNKLGRREIQLMGLQLPYGHHLFAEENSGRRHPAKSGRQVGTIVRIKLLEQSGALSAEAPTDPERPQHSLLLPLGPFLLTRGLAHAPAPIDRHLTARKSQAHQRPS
jgi:hypothetical protein